MITQGKVGFLGSFQVDFIMYCARTLSRMGKKVLVVDESPEGEIDSLLFHNESRKLAVSKTGEDCFHLPQGVAEQMEYHISVISQNGVDFTSASRLQEQIGLEESYEFLLFYFGNPSFSENLKEMDEIFALSFCDYPLLNSLRRLMKELALPMHVILRNVCDNPKYRKSFFFFLEQENAFIEERFLLPYDEFDETYRIRMQYETVGEFKDISTYMEKVLRKVLYLICGEDMGKIAKALKRAERGSLF